jgi:hypothetical protein
VRAQAVQEEIVRPRPVYCPVEHLHRSRRVADDACAGRFTLCGLTLELRLPPDWLGEELPADEELRIEWTKFAWGLDLAHAYAATGDARYRETWATLVRSWIEQVPVERDATEVAARRVLWWIYAWQTFGPARFGGGFEELLLDSIRRHLRHVRAHLTPARNHRTLELYALFVAALALPELDPGGAVLRFAVRELEENLRTDFREDGVHRESSTHYHLIVLRSLLAWRENARRFGLRLATDVDARLSRACDFALHCHRPDGGVPALSDADGRGYPELLELAATLLGRPEVRWAATAGRQGSPPDERSASFPAGGYFFQRSGWGVERPFRDERFLVFDCGPLGDGGHGHYDLLSVELAAGGRPLVVDPGRYTYAEGRPNLRRWFKGTAAHNTVCVDGLDQTPYRRGKPRGAVAEGIFLGRVSGPGLDALYGEARSPAYDAVHRRRVVFVAGAYWVLEDRLEAATAHTYDLRFQLAPDVTVTLVVREDEHVTFRADGFALSVCPAPAAAVEQGWVSPEYGRRLPAPVLSVVQVRRREASFVSLLAPIGRGEPGPTLHVRGDGEVEVDGGSWRDRLSWRPGRAAVAWERETS